MIDEQGVHPYQRNVLVGIGNHDLSGHANEEVFHIAVQLQRLYSKPTILLSCTLGQTTVDSWSLADLHMFAHAHYNSVETRPRLKVRDLY